MNKEGFLTKDYERSSLYTEEMATGLAAEYNIAPDEELGQK